MKNEKPHTIRLSVTISGPAEEVLREVSRVRCGDREAMFSIDALFPGSPGRYREFRQIPRVFNGNTQAARESLNQIVRQRLISDDAAERLSDLIDQAASWTD